MADEMGPARDLWRRAQGVGGPADALHALTALRARLAEFERQHVSDMLAQGATWAEVAQTLGITRQAAHHRYRKLPRARPPSSSSSEVQSVLVTGSARSVVRLARDEATSLGTQDVGTEHLLLALTCASTGRVARALESAGVDEHALRTILQPTIVPEGHSPAGHGGFTDYAREVLEGSLREALERREGFIGSDHLLLALLRNPAGGAAQTLDALGVEPQTLFATLASQP